jgi:hypothetical protein
MEARGIKQEAVTLTVSDADQQLEENGLVIFHRIFNESDRAYLLRVFVNIEKEPPMIVTCYLTTKITKYYESKI